MFTRKPSFVARQREVNEPPDIAEYLGLQPMRWSESYDMYGEKYEWAKQGGYDASSYNIYGRFKTKCKICGNYSSDAAGHADFARFEHFIHCSKEHNYAFPKEDILIKPKDPELQDIIVKSQLYDLPLPGFEFHENCLKQVVDGRTVCALHNMEGTYKQKGRLMY